MIKDCDVKGKRILELGALEGDDTFTLQNMGAIEVIAIEGRKDNYIKCCERKLDKCKFIYGDIEEYNLEELGYFDLCIASGIFYHFMNPSSVIRKLAKITDNIYVCCRLPTEEWFKDFPKEDVYDINSYKGKKSIEPPKGTSNVSGLGEYSIWLYKEELLRVLDDVGFNNIKIIEEYDVFNYGNIKTKYIILLTSKKKVNNNE